MAHMTPCDRLCVWRSLFEDAIVHHARLATLRNARSEPSPQPPPIPLPRPPTPTPDSSSPPPPEPLPAAVFECKITPQVRINTCGFCWSLLY